jgi:anti-sigma regulatory factor (Ser/Thr protein kinase)
MILIEDFITQLKRHYVLDNTIEAYLGIVIDEVVSNVYNNNTETTRINIDVAVSSNCITLLFADYGIPFNPLENPPPNTMATVEERIVGGLGIHLVRTLSNSVTYSYANNTNVLTIEKLMV